MDDQAEVQSPEERIESLLDAGLLTGEETPHEEVEDESETEATEEVEEEKEESEDEEEKSPATIKLKWNGEEVEKPLEEVVELAQKGHDYTQKTQQLAEQRKQVEEEAQAVKAQEQQLVQQAQFQQAFLKELATVKALDDQIAAYAKIDWQQLSDTDPVQAQKLFFTYSSLQNQKQSAIGELNTKHRQAEQANQQRLADMQAKGAQELPKLIPNFNDSMAKDLQQFAKELKSDIAQSFNPNDYKVLWMAQQYAKLQESKPQITNKLASKPSVVKPGAKDAKAIQQTNSAKARQTLRQSGRMEDAASLLERMLK
jgi:hypothetical protein